MRTRLITAASCLVTLLVVLAASAAQDPVLRRGFNPDGVYAFDGVDSVDVFTGNLTVNIPLGQEYRSSGTLAYRFGLVYNANFWDYLTQRTTNFAGQTEMRAQRYTSLKEFETDSASISEGHEALPARINNAGIGWRVSLGDLRGGFVPGGVVIEYVDESGSEHQFFRTLHPGADSGGEILDFTFATAYTRDGTYLRLRRADAGGVIGMEVAFPNGIVKRFSCVAGCESAGVQAQWELDAIVDPFGNALEVVRSPNARPAAGATWTWTFTERAGSQDKYLTKDEITAATLVRRHTAVYLVKRVYRPRDYPFDVAWEVQLDKLQLAAAAGKTATYSFVYQDALVYRPAQSNWTLGNTRDPYLVMPYGADGRVTLGLLKSLTLLDGDGTTTDGTWNFHYFGDSWNGRPEPEVVRRTHLYPWSYYSARLEMIQYPTGGGMRYEYENRGFIRVACPGDDSIQGRFQRFTSIRQRQPIDAGGNAVGTPYIYAGENYFLNQRTHCETDLPCSVGSPGCSMLPKELTATVVDPLGKATVYFFTTYLGDSGTWNRREYGLPFSRAASDGEGRFISEEVYDCSLAGIHSLSRVYDSSGLTDQFEALRNIVPRNRRPNAVSKCTGPLRSTYVKYENSGVTCPVDRLDGCSNTNRRLVSTKTEYRDFCTPERSRLPNVSPNCIVAPTVDNTTITTDFSQFDGLGHYRMVKTRGNLYAKAYGEDAFGAAKDTRDVVTWYNDGVTYDPASYTLNGRNLGDAAAPWVLNTYSLIKKAHVDSTQYAHYLFDPASGFLMGVRALAAFGRNDTTPAARGTIGTTDALVRYSRVRATVDGLPGVITHAKSWGGDAANNAGGPLVPGAAEPSAKPEYWMSVTSIAGTVKKTEYRDCDGNPALVLQNDTIDAATGYPLVGDDGSGVQTQYAYDALGRFTSITPPGQAAIVYTYPSLLQINALQTSSAGSGAAYDEYTYDVLGRRSQTRHRVKDAMNKVQIDYGADGLPSRRSNAAGLSTDPKDLQWTNFEYDVFGRPLKITPPQAGHSLRISYFGVQRQERLQSGAATQDGSTPQTKLLYDAFGRVVRVDEPIVADTQYTYDMTDRLIRVEQRGEAGSGTAGQVRTFLYDGRGFLKKEQPAELGTTQIDYSPLDSRGNARAMTYAGADSTDFNLTFTYDAAERVTSVSGRDGVLKTFEYSHTRLARSSRVNFVPKPLAASATLEIPVERIFLYDTYGRPTSAQTKASDFTATVGYRYDDLGNVVRIGYPSIAVKNCVGSNCTDVAPGPPRAVTYDYVNGALDTLCDGAAQEGLLCTGSGRRDFLSGIAYHPNGLWKEMLRSNGIRDFQEIQNDEARPSKLFARVGGAGTIIWTSGDIVYDGAGNVRRLDSDVFRYDGSNRLVYAEVGDPRRNATAVVKQSYAYDKLGNLLTVTTENDPATSASFAYNKKTNRLTAGTYDAAGNLNHWDDPRLPAGSTIHVGFGPFNTAKSAIQSKPAGGRQFARVMVYDAADERVGILAYALKESNAPRQRDTWSIRGLGNEILREFTREERVDNQNLTSTWSWSRDYLYRGRALAVEIAPAATGDSVRHMHLDHIGSVRAVSGNNSTLIETRKYLPFGQQIAETATQSRMQFAGHERDSDQVDGGYADVDYMHARHYSPALSRFLSLDPVGGSPESPQSWNRYAYARNNPMSLIDPTGRRPLGAAGSERDPDGDGQPGCNMCGGDSGAQSTPSEEAAAGGYPRVDDEITVTAEKDSRAPDVNYDKDGGFERRSAFLVFGAMYADYWIPGMEQWAHYLAGVGGGTQGTPLAHALMAIVQYDDPDLERKSNLVDTKNGWYGLGWVNGFAAMIWAGNNYQGFLRAPKPPVQTKADWHRWQYELERGAEQLQRLDDLLKK
ncbi:MAG TPA: RHS repeat-associated core domain-containing protein [Thermoanaerobaculia bacterium]|nr:RHS repeat-associated core domain-containing protein [Thermoanaerobaculia bacterium]